MRCALIADAAAARLGDGAGVVSFLVVARCSLLANR
jgi:hypothetical protein